MLDAPVTRRYWTSNNNVWPREPNPLDSAVRTGNLDMVRLLLNFGISPNQHPGFTEYQSPLYAAAAINHEPIVRELLKAGAHAVDDLPFMVDLRPVPLGIIFICLEANKSCGAARLAKAMVAATRSNNVLLLDYFISFGGDVNKPYQGRSLLYHAAWHSNLSTFEKLIARGAEVRKESNGDTLLHAARDSGIVKWLLKHGAEVDAPSALWETPLVTACMANSLEIVQILLDAGANVDGLAIRPEDMDAEEYVRRTKRSTTPLHIAVQYDQQAMTKLLLERGADPLLERGPVILLNSTAVPQIYTDINRLRTRLNLSTRPLDEAAAYSLGCLRMIRQSGVGLNTARSDGQSIAHVMMYILSIGPLRGLAEMGVDFGAKDDAGETILHRAARNCSGQEMYKFCQLPLDLNTLNNKGQTALMVACYRPRTGAAEVLIERGANVFIKVRRQRKGEDAFLIALRKKIGPRLTATFIKEGLEPWHYLRFNLNRARRRRLHKIIQIFPTRVLRPLPASRELQDTKESKWKPTQYRSS